MSQIAPATLEGWYALHQVFSTDWSSLRALMRQHRAEIGEEARKLWSTLAAGGEGEKGGWSAAFRLVGGGGDWMFVHFRQTLEELADVQLRLRDSALGELLRLEYDYLSVTEAGLYHATAEAARELTPGTPDFRARIDESRAAELASAHIQTRLFPQVPEGMRFVSFYPMTKRRTAGANWYTLPVDERSRLMREHGMTGRTFAGRVFQVITGSVGLDDWEWGVTLFARDPLEFKRIVTEMRYDEASAVYGEFGRFFTGIRFAPDEWPALLGARGGA
ncbi:MAG TPA: hydrogen peroxide-dependent heme synthase [Longimicrobium sp.]|jgi:chlorite dismutase|uniref:hydrogen peroxide-dependent heme synthase n=1 Tax=Longimicrobium sp. TaxID=2029185 RepID=UPI002ED7A5FF